MSGEPIFIEAHKALNGLRVASLTWSVFLKDCVEGQPLLQHDRAMSSCGVIDGSPTLLLCYVDDYSSNKAFHRVFKELSKHVKVSRGKIALAKDGGGSLKFLGRMIFRQSCSPTLVMQVDSSYMDGTCEEFGIKVPKGVASPPDIKPVWRQRLRSLRLAQKRIQGTEGCWKVSLGSSDPDGFTALYVTSCFRPI